MRWRTAYWRVLSWLLRDQALLPVDQQEQLSTCLSAAAFRHSEIKRCPLLAVEGPDDNRAALITQLGWEEWLLEPLLDGGVCAAAGRTASPNQPMQASLGRHLPWRWQGLEMQLLRRMLSTLLVFCVTRVQHGWEALDQAAAHIR